MKLAVDFTKPVRPIGRQNGTNNGPLMTFSDRTAEFREMGVELVRFHETHTFNTKCIELPFIFRDFDADENDENNYYFAETDAVIRAALDAGCEVIYRLGMGTEGTIPKIFTSVPKDYQKWANIAIHVMMHYNEGWANGHFWNVRKWEIWNEPDLQGYWPGPRSAYIDFYCTVAPLLKAHDEKNQIGSGGFSTILPPAPPKEGSPKEVVDDYNDRCAMVPNFLERVSRENIPMDFFAFHGYCRNGEIGRRRIRYAMKLFREYGFEGKAETYNTESGTMFLHRDAAGHWDYTQMYDFFTAVTYINYMIAMQRLGVNGACYYDADERNKFCGLYDFDGSRKNHFYSLKTWKYLRECGTEAESSEAPLPVSICAATGNGKKRILVCTEAEAKRLTLSITGVKKGAPYSILLFDETHPITPWKKGVFNGETLVFTLPRQSAAIVEF